MGLKKDQILILFQSHNASDMDNQWINNIAYWTVISFNLELFAACFSINWFYCLMQKWFPWLEIECGTSRLYSGRALYQLSYRRVGLGGRAPAMHTGGTGFDSRSRKLFFLMSRPTRGIDKLLPSFITREVTPFSLKKKKKQKKKTLFF